MNTDACLTLPGSESRSHSATAALGLALAGLLLAAPAAAEPAGPGDALTPFTLEDQHGEERSVDEATKMVLFSRDMDGGALLKDALADVEPGALASLGAAYVADISGMPALVARMFAVPAMRKRPYPMLLDREGQVTAQLPDVEGQATLIFLEGLVVSRVAHLGSAAELRETLFPPAEELDLE